MKTIKKQELEEVMWPGTVERLQTREPTSRQSATRLTCFKHNKKGPLSQVFHQTFTDVLITQEKLILWNKIRSSGVSFKNARLRRQNGITKNLLCEFLGGIKLPSFTIAMIIH